MEAGLFGKNGLFAAKHAVLEQKEDHGAARTQGRKMAGNPVLERTMKYTYVSRGHVQVRAPAKFFTEFPVHCTQ